MIRHLFLWLATTPVGHYMKDSTYGFATVEAIHLLGLASLFGVVVLFGLAILRVALAGQTPAATARGIYPVFLAALTAMLATGVLLVASKPLRYYLSSAFRLKIALLVLAVTLYLYLNRRIIAANPAASPRADQALAVLLLALWLGVGLAGRFIGLL
jgi:hypothetical protein